jgi:hypothetical protein
MPPSRYVKLIVFAPVTHADIVRDALMKVGAGTIGNYTGCSFSARGIGRYLPGKDAKLAFGTVGEYVTREEERIEVRCSIFQLSEVITAMKKAHPDEEVAYEIYPLLEI